MSTQSRAPASAESGTFTQLGTLPNTYTSDISLQRMLGCKSSVGTTFVQSNLKTINRVSSCRDSQVSWTPSRTIWRGGCFAPNLCMERRRRDQPAICQEVQCLGPAVWVWQTDYDWWVEAVRKMGGETWVSRSLFWYTFDANTKCLGLFRWAMTTHTVFIDALFNMLRML